jgi:hypothetical protein
MNSDIVLTSFTEKDQQSFLPEMKIGLLGTVNPQGQPHLSLISSFIASSPTQLAFGQFTEGLSKEYIRQNPKIGFLIMSLDKHVWCGKANFSHTAKEGKEYDFYNNIPMFRYNAYFGVHTVYYMDLVNHSGESPLPMNTVIRAAILSTIARKLGRLPGEKQVLNAWTRKFMDKLDNLKFLAFIGKDGYPIIIPAIQTQSLDAGRLIFSTALYGEALKCIPAGCSLAVFGMSLSMEDVLMRGTYQGIRRVGGVNCGIVDLDWVYNAMPPVPGQIYPPMPMKAVTEF